MNQITPKTQQDIDSLEISENNRLFGEVYVNPYHEKWKRGRPTKAQIEKRKLYHKWNIDNRDYLLRSLALLMSPFEKMPMLKVKDGKVFLEYKSRF